MMEQNTTKLSGSSILKTLLRFAGPFLIANLLQTAYSAADMIIVGLYSADVSDISAISNASHVINVLLYTISSFAAGGTVLIGQLAGAGRDREIRKSVGSITLFFLYVGLAVSILTYALAQQLVSLMKIPVEAEAASVSYLRICGAGMLFSTGYHVFAAVMRGLGDSRGPMIFIGFTCCVNVVLDFLFVARLHLGVTGTAYATVIAQALSVLFSAVQLRLKHQRLFTPRTPGYFSMDPGVIQQLIRIGLPMAIDVTIVNISFLMISALINEQGIVASAAIGVNEKIGTLTRLPANSIASAVTVMVAHSMGAGRPERARRILWTGISVSLCMSLLPFLLMQLFPRLLLRVYTPDEAIIQAGIRYMRTFSWDSVLVCLTFNMASFFSGCRKTMFTLLRNLASTLLIRIPSAWFFCRVLPFRFENIGLSPVLASVGSFLICAVYYLFTESARRDCRPST